MAEIDSDCEIEFHPRHGGAGEQVGTGENKLHLDLNSEDESDSGSEQNIIPELHAVSIDPETDNQLTGYERRNRRPGLQQRRCDDAANRSMKGSRLLVKPDKYNGDSDWESFIAHFEICAELGGWGSRVMTLTLASCLEGQARVFYMNLSNIQKSSYPELVKHLSQRFGYTRQKSTWVSRLEARQRQQGETILSFGDDIRRLTQRAHADLDPLAQEAIALNQLFKSTTAEMKYRCIAGNCTTVSQAVDMIELYEGVVGADGGKKKSVIRVVKDEPDPETGLKAVATGLSELRVTVDNAIGRIEKLEKRENVPAKSNKRACYVCNSTDHFMNQCPWKQDNSRSQQQKSSFKKYNGKSNSLN